MRFSLILFLLLMTGLAFSQSGEFKEWMELNPELTIDEDELQQLEEWNQRKRNINQIGLDELKQLPFLREDLALAIIAHREITGGFQSLLELQVIDGMTPSLYRMLLLFLTVEYSQGKPTSGNKSEYIGLFHLHSPNKRGYKESVYAGKPFRQWHRIKLMLSPRTQIGLSLENDAGESLRWKGNQKGFDFGTAYLHHRFGKQGAWILGDFRLRTGQGILHGLGGNFGSPTWVSRVYAMDRLRPYRGSDENLFMRGACLQNSYRKVSYTLMASSLRSDGRLTSDALSETGTGLHRTESELSLRKNYLRQALGAAVKYRMGRAALGMTYLYLVEPQDKSHYLSLDYTARLGRFYTFGEFLLANEGLSLVQGVVFSASQKLDVSMLLRAYPRENFNPYAAGFSRFSGNQNERGFYIAAEHQSRNKQRWKFFADWVYRPFPSYLVSRPYWAKQFFLQTEKRVGGSEMLLRIQYKTGELDTWDETSRWKQTETWSSMGIRLQGRWTINEALIYASRAEINAYFKGVVSERGVLVFQEIQWRPKAERYYVILRYACFSTPSYDSRIYTYESDVLYSFSIPNYSGAGQRAYAVLRYPIWKGLDAWMKFGFTWYSSKSSIGTAWEELNQNHQADFKLLLRCRF